MIPVFFSPEMDVSDNASFSPSAGKPARAVADWVSYKFPIKVTRPQKMQREDLYRVHSREHVDGVLDGVKENGFGNTSSAVAESLLWTTGSLVSAARYALAHGGVAVSPTSGFHHAGIDYGNGFCTFNGLMLAAMNAHEWGAEKVLVIDEDAHYSDGCVDIIDKLNMYWVGLHTLGANSAGSGEDCLDRLAHAIDTKLKSDVHLVIYQAGADCHVNDPLGGVYTTEQMAERDRMVFDACRSLDVPLIWNLAGGYQRDAQGTIEPVLALHRQTMRICAEIYGYAR